MLDLLKNHSIYRLLRSGLYLGGAISMVASVLAVSPATFAASAPSQPPPGSVAIYNQDGNALYVAPASAAADNLSKVLPPPTPSIPTTDSPTDLSVGATPSTSSSDPTISNSATKTITPPGGSAGPEWIGFNTDVTTTASWWNAFFNGWSEDEWQGTNPFNCTSVSLSDQYYTGGVGISVSYPIGVGISGSGSSANWSASVKNTYYIYHQFNNIEFAGAITDVGQNESGTFQFGSSFYSINTGAWSVVGA